jgi:hypothetical protein
MPVHLLQMKFNPTNIEFRNLPLNSLVLFYKMFSYGCLQVLMNELINNDVIITRKLDY